MSHASIRLALLSGIAASAIAAPARAEEAQPIDTAAASVQGAEDAGNSNDIIVTARRRTEALQDVPQTVNVVTSETIEKLRINNASDIAQIVPGVSIEGGTAASGTFGASSGLRGVPTFLTANANPVVQLYLNDAPVGSTPGPTQTLFDIGQVEVLKGPQGTLRGRSAPTGAITFTTRRPDLDEVGGTINLSGTDRSNINAQAAVGVPLVKDVLAVRLAGVVDHNDGTGVTSVNFRAKPYAKTEAVRATVRFDPTSNFSATVMYQRLWRSTQTFAQVAGPGNGRNGPPIDASERLGITDRPNDGTNKIHFLTGQFDWRFAGQKLSYVGSYRKDVTTSLSPQDAANVVRGVEYFQNTRTESSETSHELRLSSEERIAGIFDYVIGGFYDRSPGRSNVVGPARFLSGAFGRPGTAPAEIAPVSRYTLSTLITINNVSEEKSVFGNVTAHIGEATELSAGGRYIDFERHDRFSIALQPGFNAIANPTRGLLPCGSLVPGAVASPVYSGACDIPIPGSTIQDVDRRAKYTPFLYNVSLSHKFTPDFMVYGNIGSAFRSAGPRIGFTSPTVCCTQAGGPDLGSIQDLVFQNEEKSTAYEVGFKATFLNRRARLNVSLFKQDFDNFYFNTQATQYLSITNPANPGGPNGATVSSSEFTVGGDATVKGIDVEAGFQITPRWNVNLGFTWADAKLKNALIPCNDSDFNGIPDTGVATVQGFISHGVIVARCRSNDAISRVPKWNLTVQSEYSAPISDQTDGFIRGNFNYYPDNPNASQGVVIDKYGLLNMYLGLRDREDAWEVSLFANNLLNEQQILSFNSVALVSSGSPTSFFPQGPSGYNQVTYTPRREFGVLVRFSFGSR